MSNIFRMAGRLYGKLSATNTAKNAGRALDAARRAVVREASIARMRLRIAFFRRKHTGHLALLGKRVHRLVTNGVDPATHPQVSEIIRTLGSIECEIAAAEAELMMMKNS